MHTTLIDTGTLQENLDHLDWLVVDCRFSLADSEQGRRAYHASHIPNALYAHLDQDLSAPVIRGRTGRHPLPDMETIVHTFSQWGIDEYVQVVAYDDGAGMVAGRLWWLLRWLGHDGVAVLDGGWARWRQDGRSETQEIPQPAPRTFTPHVRAHMVTDAGAVRAAFDDPSVRMIDARAGERYRGEQEPIDPVAGHIPTALCAPCSENVGADGRFLPPEALRARFQELLGNVAADRVISYCGSGVTACHNLLAMAHAGLGDGKLYPGSWSEWITDPSRPIATGD